MLVVDKFVKFIKIFGFVSGILLEVYFFYLYVYLFFVIILVI